MRTIHKIKLDLMTPAVLLPDGSKVLFVADQGGDPHLWYQTNTAEIRVVERKFYIYGTGQQVPWERIYIGSCFSGPLVWHVFE